MKVGDRVVISTGNGWYLTGGVVAVFPNDGDANIKVCMDGGESYGDYYESELEVI